MLDGEEVSCLIGNELVKVDEAVEEDSHLRAVLLQLLERKMAIHLGPDHIIHLAKQVYK